jgi:hypothetical protein
MFGITSAIISFKLQFGRLSLRAFWEVSSCESEEDGRLPRLRAGEASGPCG